MEVVFSGANGRLHGAYQKGKHEDSPVALILHGHPDRGGHMNEKVAYTMYHSFAKQGFAVLRFNFRGTGRSEGEFTYGEGELADAAAALDWIQQQHEKARSVWIAGLDFGAYIAFQLLIRRPGINSFIALSPPLHEFDFSFLSLCPSSGLVVHGEKDDEEYHIMRKTLVDRLNEQKEINVKYHILRGADGKFNASLPDLHRLLTDYIATEQDKEHKLI